jgi:16S rRNA (uracil1498-N3)-methyltransferase
MAKPPRFFVIPDQICDRRVIISGEDVRHIATVLRMQPGQLLTLCDGKGTEFTASITQVGRTEIAAEIVNKSLREVVSSGILLGQGLPKSDKMDFIVQKATELGVSTIVPLITERTIVKIKNEEKRVARWQKICREAAMQSDRIEIPLVSQVVTLKKFLHTLAPDPGALLLLPWEEGTESIKSILRRNAAAKEVIVLIGPEGGFSASEAASAKARGFHLVSLGPNILRTETAALAALSMVLYETGIGNNIACPAKPSSRSC